MRVRWARSTARRVAGASIAIGLLLPAAPPAAAAGGDAVTLTGTLRVAIADDFAHGRSETRYGLETAHGHVPLVVRGNRAPAMSGTRATIRGTRLADGRVLVDAAQPLVEAPSAVAGGVEAPAPDGAAPYGWSGAPVRHVAVVIGTYTDETVPVGTPDEALAALTGTGGSTKGFFETTSRGSVTIDATVLGTWSLGFDSCTSGDPFYESIDAVVAKAATLGINLAAYDHVIMWTPAACGSGWVALGELPGSFIQVSAEYPDVGRTDELAITAAHEMGHNMGLRHANGLACHDGGGTPVALSATCVADEYGDPFSTMGGDQGVGEEPEGFHFLSPLFDSAELAHLGWLAPAEEQTVTAAGSYDLVPTYSADPGVRLLRIRRTVPPVATDPPPRYDLRTGWLTVELRTEPPAGPWDTFGVNAPVRTGVIVRYVEDGYDDSGVGYLPTMGSTYLVDTAPATVGAGLSDWNLHDAPLQVGDTFTDSVKGTQITLTSLDASGATVSVAFPSGNPPAAATVAAPVITAVTPGDSQATISWTTPATSGTVPVQGYTVRSYPGGQLCWTVTPSPTTCTVTGLANGTAYRFTVTAGTAGGYWQMSLPPDPATPVGPPSAIVLPLPAWRASQSIRVSWTGNDDGGPVDGYDVRYRSAPWNGGYGAWTTWLSGTTATSGSRTGSPGRTYCFATLARNDGVAGPWSSQACTAVPLDDRSLKATSAWTRITGSAYYRSTALRATRQGSAITRTSVAARRVALVASRCSTCGSVKVYWNGVYRKTISLRASTTQNKVVISILSFSSVRTGTLKLVVGTSGRRVTIDGVAISRQ